MIPTPVIPLSQETLFDPGPKPLSGVFSNDQIIEAAFTYWRQRGFPYRELTVHECMSEINKLTLTDDVSLRGTDTAYHVADTYHRHRFESSAVGMKSPLSSYGDDKLLRRAIRLMIEYGQTPAATQLAAVLSMVSGTQACANFRPGFALAIYRKFCRPGANILDTSSGYGGRLVGWMASGLGGTYTGIDPSVKSCLANIRMAKELGYGNQVTQLLSPAEDLDPEGLRGQFDFAFTSPPYFVKERYAANDDDASWQSWSRYPDADSWIKGFLQPLMRLQYTTLKPGCVSVMNVQDVKINSKIFPLTEWTIAAAELAGFTQVPDDDALRLSHRFGSGSNEVATEPVYVFRT